MRRRAKDVRVQIAACTDDQAGVVDGKHGLELARPYTGERARDELGGGSAASPSAIGHDIIVDVCVGGPVPIAGAREAPGGARVVAQVVGPAVFCDLRRQ